MWGQTSPFTGLGAQDELTECSVPVSSLTKVWPGEIAGTVNHLLCKHKDFSVILSTQVKNKKQLSTMACSGHPSAEGIGTDLGLTGQPAYQANEKPCLKNSKVDRSGD